MHPSVSGSTLSVTTNCVSGESCYRSAYAAGSCDPESSSSDGTNVGMIVGIVIGVLVLLVGAGSIAYYFMYMAKPAAPVSGSGVPPAETPHVELADDKAPETTV